MSLRWAIEEGAGRSRKGRSDPIGLTAAGRGLRVTGGGTKATAAQSPDGRQTSPATVDGRGQLCGCADGPHARAGGRSGPPSGGCEARGGGRAGGRAGARPAGGGGRRPAGRNSRGEWWRRQRGRSGDEPGGRDLWRRQHWRRRARRRAESRGDGAEEVGVPGAPAGLGKGRSAQEVGAVGRPQGCLLL